MTSRMNWGREKEEKSGTDKKRCQEPLLLTTGRKIGKLMAWDDQNEPQRVVGFTTF